MSKTPTKLPTFTEAYRAAHPQTPASSTRPPPPSESPTTSDELKPPDDGLPDELPDDPVLPPAARAVEKAQSPHSSTAPPVKPPASVDPLLQIGFTKTRMSDLTAAVMALPTADWYLAEIVNTAAMLGAGLPQLSYWPKELRDPTFAAIQRAMRDVEFVSSVVRFAYFYNLMLPVQSIYRFAVVLAAMRYFQEAAASAPVPQTR